MHSRKSHKRSTQCRYRRHRAQRKWKVAQHQKEETERWILSTVEGKQTHVATQLSPLITTKVQGKSVEAKHTPTATTRKAPNKNQKRNDKAKKTAAITKPDLTEELRVDVDRTVLNGDAQMKASVDSGVSCRSSQSTSNESISEPAECKEVRESGVSFATKFAQNVMEFVSHAQKKIQEQTAAPLPKIEHIPKPRTVQPLKEAPRRRRERVCKLLPSDVEFCSYMMETYDEDYEAMAKDPKNVFMDDAKALSRKIRVFRESPQYEEYLQSKAVASK